MKFNKYFFENFSTDTPFDMKNPSLSNCFVHFITLL